MRAGHSKSATERFSVLELFEYVIAIGHHGFTDHVIDQWQGEQPRETRSSLRCSVKVFTCVEHLVGIEKILAHLECKDATVNSVSCHSAEARVSA
jgi:hypothetical protein